MLLNLLHRIVAIPAVYDFTAWVAGAPASKRTVTPIFGRIVTPGARVLDIGGGTGMNLSYILNPCDYTCFDNDPQKIEGFRQKHPDATAVQGDAAKLPFPDGSFDVAMMTAVSHHLPDDIFRASLQEIARVIGTSGRFIFIDALWEPNVLRSRALWSVDRGADPRPYADLRKIVEQAFIMEEETRWAVHHRYVCWVLRSAHGDMVAQA